MQCSFEGMCDTMLYCIHKKFFTWHSCLLVVPCKAVCSVLRTPIASIDHLRVQLPDPDSLKVQWSLKCFNGELPFPIYTSTHTFMLKTMFNLYVLLVNADAGILGMSYNDV